MSSALVMVLVAAFVAPSILGVYAAGTLALTFYQSVTDAAIRQIAVRAINTGPGRLFMQRYRFWAVSGGSVFLTAVLVIVYNSLSETLSSQVWALLLLLPVPFLSAVRVGPVARIQVLGKWKVLGIIQVYSAGISLLISVPILLWTHSIWASTSQLLLAEMIFTVLVVFYQRRSRLVSQAESGHLESGPSERREFSHLALYSALGWMQSQADRVLLGFFAGPGALGLYSFAQALSRSVGDALSTSTANVLRPQILNGSLSREQVCQVIEPLLVRAIRLSGLSTVAVMLIATYIFPLFLSDLWVPALEATAIMGLAVGPTLLAWTITVALVAIGRVRWAAPIKGVGVILALPIALAAISDIKLAATFVVGRDVLIMLLMLLVSKGTVSGRVLLHFLGWFLGLVCVCLLIT